MLSYNFRWYRSPSGDVISYIAQSTYGSRIGGQSIKSKPRAEVSKLF